MTIPPFPLQDLAKLVLGYLAEEQLMTAYDEFLQASPYLDALGNEYDRIFMTSLKNILAEYRAVKIYVETCKPFILRKKVFQCSNLLEMVKFLIQNVDINKIQLQENNNQTKYSLEKQNSVIQAKTNTCDVCNASKLDSCNCKSKNSVSSTPSNTHISTSSIDNSVETTPLSDLPGNHVTVRKKNARALNKDLSELGAAIELPESGSNMPMNNEFIQRNLPQNSHVIVPQMRGHEDPSHISLSEKVDSLETRQKEEFNSILNKVCNKNEHVDNNLISKLEEIDQQSKTSIAGYSEFATGVNNAGGSSANVNVPDSSTSENLHVQIPTKETNKFIHLEQSDKITHTKTQYLLKVANVKNNMTIQPNEVVSINTVNKCVLPRIKPKTDENKIKILSDIKVDKSFNNSEIMGANKPKVLRNATSTPLLQMQTIVINGTPVYKHNPFGQQQNYTKDEIMAMPTIILAPAPGPSQIPVSQCEDSVKNQVPTIPTSNSARHLGPLILDVTSSSRTGYVDSHTNTCKQTVEEHKFSTVEPQKEEIKQKEDTVAKTVDITSASAPKDNTVVGTTETSTPQVFPPLRKSSSTPRRTSHVRVLDFTTPRRILHESINKCVPNMKLDHDHEVILSKSPNVTIPVTVEEDVANKKIEEGNSGSMKENSKTKIKKNWDADLRVLATVPEKEINLDVPSSPKSKSKQKSTKKSKASKGQTTKKSDKSGEEKLSSKKKTPKVKPVKRKCISEEDVEIITIPDEKMEMPLKPTINIIAGVDKNPNTSSEMNKGQNKSNNEDNNCDTPEMERISLQNEIGSKLNISDLLETPYKQVLYDIQMETPRFLGPDIPDDPMSDIKIMNIPTPRFLTAATPSSYSSRPTDYSSGGSYYKPEDQDYMRVHDELDCPVTSTKETVTNETSISDDSKEKENMKPSRPVRECTKNVSYYNIANMSNKTKLPEKGDMDSSIDSTGEVAIEKAIPCTPITPKTKENNSKKGSSKKRKTPIKREMAKSFMKIKPRRPTPTKKCGRGKRKSVDPATQSKVQTRKKSGSNKEGSVNATPVINPAPTKSRRKSSTPRKLHCGKSFHSESSGHDSPEFDSKNKEKVPEPSFVTVHDSDTEQLPLRWSDDGSQEPQPVVLSIPNESEDILKIKEYIETTVETNKSRSKKEVSLHIDLVKRGFDLETAKSIERDLLDTPPHVRHESETQDKLENVETEKVIIIENKTQNAALEKTLESDCSTGNNLQIVHDDEEVEEEIELSVHDCDEESTNYFVFNYDATKDTPKLEQIKLKEKFSMEVCIEDGVSIRLRATPFSLLLDQDPQSVEYLDYSYRETEMAVSSISNFEKLYTPLKESLKAQCFEIFDSTLTSLDTPLKPKSPKQTETEVTITEIVLEVEKVEENEKLDTKKRKRVQSGHMSDEDETKNKKAKPETQLMFSSTNIQNFDIDSVLSKLHGP